ncbi:DUF1761 domain-containing protein [Aestuariivita sp.]|jgi:hypothetical protein|uniref:DUF1761 domain-containing protein n=1 Tax=Aestuariivita sp. TaxID=1872407 RepID=UPI00217227CB|nr:DUF1761 domain-containing protein [Aestuariivita sp.]MCE8005547.1 DUF1761 domain-containing protein [Aestuariivita sp.]
MEILNVFVAGVASFMFGAIWYSVLAKPWVAVSGVAVDPDTGKPANASNPKPYVIGVIAAILVAGMMRHIFSGSGVDTVWEGAVSGLGIGAFLASPWLATNYGFAGRPMRLILIDGGYATFGCAIIGIVLTLF